MVVSSSAPQFVSGGNVGLWTVLKRTFNSWQEHNTFRLSAAMAFYSILSLAPLVILGVTIAGLMFGDTSAQERIIHQVRDTIGAVGAETVRQLLRNRAKPSTGLFATTVGILTLLFGASGIFGELRDSLNTIWEVKPPASANGLMGFLKQRAALFGMVLSVGFLLLLSLVVSTGLAMVGRYFDSLLPAPEFVLVLMSDTVSLAGVTVLFALIFKYVPEIYIGWKDIWIGAFVTSVLFTAGKILIGLYLGKAAVGSPYGAAGSMVAVTVWVYYSSLIFFFGAEFTHEYSCAKKRSTPTRIN
jgi:membrane protein